jgi:hypothetical protein
LYTILLVLSVIAVALAITFLWLSMKLYDYKIKNDLPATAAIHCRSIDAPSSLAATLYS